MPDYQKGKIYKIVGGGKTYYGSTCEPTLARRLAKHRNKYNGYKKGKDHYVSSFKVLDEPDCAIYLIENYPCSSKDELHAREGYYIQNNECVNKIKNVVHTVESKKEYERMRNQRQDRKDAKNKRGAETVTCTCGQVMRRDSIQKHLKTNKHKGIKEPRKDKKEPHEKRCAQEVTCTCGQVMRRDSMHKHIKTKKHIEYMNNNTV